MDPDAWNGAALAGRFADDAYATAKGYVRTVVLHRQLLEHIPAPPATVLDVGGGAGQQSRLPHSRTPSPTSRRTSRRGVMDRDAGRDGRRPLIAKPVGA